jgi:hypothetical protein
LAFDSIVENYPIVVLNSHLLIWTVWSVLFIELGPAAVLAYKSRYRVTKVRYRQLAIKDNAQKASRTTLVIELSCLLAELVIEGDKG